jgi:acyl carrier protein/ribosomal protein L37AE/L43A
MTPMPTDQEIYECVRQAITAIRQDLGDHLTLDSELGEELGLESLDYVDIEFRLETTFGVEFYHGSAVERLSELLAPRQLEEDGLLTADGAAVLRLRLPEIDPERLRAGQPVAGIEAKFTPRTWIRVVKELVHARPQHCQSCGSEHLEVMKPSILRCTSCGIELRSPDGEECLVMWASTVPASLPERMELRTG